MPHILVEYSSNLAPQVEVRGLMGALHGAAVESGLFEPASVRSRALPRDIYLIADGAPENVFLHITARLRAGRSIENRKSLGESLLKAAKNAISALPPSTPIALSVEVHEIDPEMLFRHITLK
ncbi:MAG: 5-carboxymethyl-2-hydroxymuconate Delta-isomerase [Roseiarcus sp.]|jgi:5-carboxymethyl-2-hydroxymuconate isomerase